MIAESIVGNQKAIYGETDYIHALAVFEKTCLLLVKIIIVNGVETMVSQEVDFTTFGMA